MASLWGTLGILAALLLLIGRGIPVVAALATLTALAALAALLGLAAFPPTLFEWWERFAASLALVFVALILGGLLLSAAGFPLDGLMWLGLIALMLMLIWLTTVQAPPPGPQAAAGPRVARQRPKSSRIWLIAGIALIQATLAAGLGVAGALTAPQTTFTQLSLSRPPFAGEVVVSLANHEGAAETYRVDVLIDGRVAARWSPVPLENGARWTGRVLLPDAWQAVTAQVYRPPNATTPYRQTVLWNREPA
ncbi:MAG: hypothetical protein RMM58_03640 [Chloroflexota bacterium]|nr:DUF1616 domain-containing protein [Dehalococcoidia bacterium]MDW8252953.1 hypothetical protein [Chloroflexota bacterium]